MNQEKNEDLKKIEKNTEPEILFTINICSIFLTSESINLNL